ncbi:MAG: hypothetical protein ACOCZR_02680 [Halanaerobiales bacterium]
MTAKKIFTLLLVLVLISTLTVGLVGCTGEVDEEELEEQMEEEEEPGGGEEDPFGGEGGETEDPFEE